MVFVWIIGTTSASTLIGLGLWRLLRRLKQRWLRISVSLAAGCIILIFAGGVFLYIGFTPATDELTGGDRHISIYVTSAGVWDVVSAESGRRFQYSPESSSGRVTASDGIIRSPNSGPIPTEQFFDRLSSNFSNSADGTIKKPRLFQRLRFSFPAGVRIREDFPISLSVDQFGVQCSSGEQLFLLSASSSANARTSDRCTSKIPDSFSGACTVTTACSSHVVWDITPVESGELLFTFSLPTSIDLGRQTMKEQREGYIVDTGAPQWQSVHEV
jgi:hypothetical protein